MDWKTQTHTLAHPIKVGDREIKTVTMREPDIDALEAIEELDIEQGKPLKVKHMRGIIVALSDLTHEEAGKLHRDDLAGLGEFIAPLLGDQDEEAEQS
jgi:hypothetical protein